MRDSGICIDDLNGDVMTYHTTKEVRARKAHRCTECGDVIPKDAIYEYVRGICDGEWVIYKTCMTCTRIRRDLFKCGYIYGGLWDDLAEHFSLDIPDGEDKSMDWLK